MLNSLFFIICCKNLIFMTNGFNGLCNIYQWSLIQSKLMVTAMAICSPRVVWNRVILCHLTCFSSVWKDLLIQSNTQLFKASLYPGQDYQYPISCLQMIQFSSHGLLLKMLKLSNTSWMFFQLWVVYQSTFPNLQFFSSNTQTNIKNRTAAHLQIQKVNVRDKILGLPQTKN